MILVTLACSIALSTQSSVFEERLIATIPEASAVYDITGSSSGAHEHHCAWSADGTRVAWIATVDGVPHTALNETIGVAFADLERPLITDDGAHYAFRGKADDAGREWALVLDGEEVARASFIGPLAFSPDGEDLGFWQVESQEGVLACLDTSSHSRWKTGRAVSVADQGAGVPMFSADGRRLVGSAKGVEESVLVLATRAGNKTIEDAKGWITAPQFSPNGREVAYVLFDETSDPVRGYTIRGKKKLGTSMDGSGFGRYSPDGRHFAYTVRKNGMTGLAIDKDSSAKTVYYGVIDMAWDSSGDRIAYVANYEGPSMVAADGEQYEEGGGMWFVVNRARGSESGEDGPGFVEVADPVFSPAGDRLAYRARRGLRWLVVVDGQRSEIYDEVGTPVFSPDGSRVAFGARKGRELLWKVMELEPLSR